jgi:hypothetical protein
MKNQNLNSTTKRKFLMVSAQTWIWVVLLVAAIPLINLYGGVPLIFGFAILCLLGFTFWNSGRSVRADIEKPAPEETNVHPIRSPRSSQTMKKAH